MRNMLESPSTILEERLEVLHDLATIRHGEQRQAAIEREALHIMFELVMRQHENQN
jgi:hypothetical protein